MKKIIAALIGALISTFIYGQQDWNTAGNVVALPNNIFGTTNNFPIRYFSNNVQRMWLNSNVTNNINGQGLENRHGFLGLGPNYTGAPAGTFNGTGPISVLHIAGEGNASGTGGYRNWMRYGISLTHNNDLMFVGQRRFGTGFDVTDAVIAWADNPGSPSDFGPDNLVFNFVSGQLPSGANADLDGTASNGREVMRLNSNGNVGMGPRFNNWNQPQSDLHINRDAAQPVWLQMSYQNLFPGANPLPNSSQYSASRGLRIGFNNAVGYIFNQENSHLIFSTNASTVTQLALERMRISHVGAPGIPATAANGSTRVAISLTPTSPLTAPRSLMHIGAPLSGQGGSTDGVRNWMNVGYLSTFDSDNMYVGLKNEGTDRQDAVIAWGDNQTDLINGSGPDNLRFIFANSQFSLSPGTPEAKSDNGQEIGRFTPACATCPVNTGSFGIGNYSPGAPNGPGTPGYVGATLDVDGDARVRSVQQDNTLTQVLVRDPNDLGRLRWRDASTLGGSLGGVCGSAGAFTLTQDRELPLGSFNITFSGQDALASRIGIGTIGCSPSAKLDVLQTQGDNDIAINGEYSGDISGFYNTFTAGIGVRGISRPQTLTECEALAAGGMFIAESNVFNYGVAGLALGNSNICEANNVGGFFHAKGTANSNIGVWAEAWITGPNDWAAYINGPGLITNGPWVPSDAQLKTNVQTIQNASQTLNQLKPVTYLFNAEAQNIMNVPTNNQYGLIAQELQAVIPELVTTTKVPKSIDITDSTATALNSSTGSIDEISVVNYQGLIPVLIAAFQEQSARITQLEAQLNDCCNAPRNISEPSSPTPSMGAVIQTNLRNAEEPTLGQNIPNPFEYQTRIPLFLPNSISKAELIFYGNDGKILQNILVADRGTVQVEVNAEALAAGIYSYTLFVDGRPVDTKRMIKN